MRYAKTNLNSAVSWLVEGIRCVRFCHVKRVTAFHSSLEAIV